MDSVFAKYYQQYPNDMGITSPCGYTLTIDPNMPYMLSAGGYAAGSAPLEANPAGMLYSTGNQNLTLMAPSADACSAGCLANYKPDPRVFQVKPLYQPTIYKGYVSSACTALGMY